MAVNWLLFGGPLVTSYHRILIAEDGVIRLDSAADAFHRPFLAGLADQLRDPWQGLWPRGAALLAAAALGLVGIRRLGPVGLAPAVVLAVHLGIYAGYDYIWARFYLPCLLFAPLGFGAVLARPESAAAPAWPRERRAWLVAMGLGVACALLAVAWGAWARRPGGEHKLEDRLTEARVSRREPGGPDVPCDYLNPNTGHFECSRLEQDWWEGWGADIRGECRFSAWAEKSVEDALPRSLLWLHAPPKPFEKEMRWQDLGPLSTMALTLGYSRSSRAADAAVEVRLNGEAIALPTGMRPGLLYRRSLSDKVRREGPNRLEIKVSATVDHDYRQLCVGARMEEP
jgi:hypothetical protein